MNLPCRWSEGGLADFAGLVRFRRRFGYPGRIDDAERVWLTFAGITGSAVVWLNSELLGLAQAPNATDFEYLITPLLQPRNELVVEVEGPADGGLWGEVALEVRRTAFLRGVQVRPELRSGRRSLEISGAVVGSAERPLELYAILDRSNVAYGLVEAAAEGKPFVLESETLSTPITGTHRVRVDLVDGAVVWYTVEQAVVFSAS
jgi:hypothetical protein